MNTRWRERHRELKTDGNKHEPTEFAVHQRLNKQKRRKKCVRVELNPETTLCYIESYTRSSAVPCAAINRDRGRLNERQPGMSDDNGQPTHWTSAFNLVSSMNAALDLKIDWRVVHSWGVWSSGTQAMQRERSVSAWDARPLHANNTRECQHKKERRTERRDTQCICDD